MRRMRGFLIATTITLVAIGVIRGGVVGIFSHLPARVTLELIAVNVVVTLVWIPFTILVAWAIDANITKRNRAIALIALGAAAVLVETWAAVLLRFAGAPMPPFVRRLVGRSDTNVLFYIAIVGACFAARGRRRQIASDLAAARLQAAAAGAQLQVLTLQLHPHFLFNALNLISQLAYESVDAAQRAVANLRALLVESLRHAVHREVSLADELSFLRAYLEIQQARFRDRLKVTIVAARGVERAAVPHLVLQPIVENAIVHGIAQRAAAGAVEVSAHRSNDRLILSVHDDGSGLSAVVRNGLGLTNTRLRLEQLFGADHRLQLASRKPHGTSVTIDIPFREIDVSATRDDGDVDEMGLAIGETPEPGRFPAWLQVVAGWAAIAVIWTEIGALPIASRSAGFSFSATLIAYSINAGLWVALTPLVVRIGRRFDVGMRPSIRAVAAHGALSIVIAVAHTALWLAALYAIGSSVFLQNLRSMFGWAIWDVAAYIAIVALSTVVALSARFRDARVTMARSQAQLASARVASLRLRLQPRVLLAALDALARVIAMDAEASEATIARIGDLLRMLLSRADREFVSVGEELELLDAYLDVVWAPSTVSRHAVDLPGMTDVVDELMPAMLFPTLAAAFQGEMDISRLDVVGPRLCLALRSGMAEIDEPLLRECLDRVHRLYAGAEQIVVAADESQRTTLQLDLPRQHEYATASDERCDLATA